MKFGVFDHLDWNGGDLTLQYEDRLRMIEALDRNGFYAYHVAEHHCTPSGRAPAPSVFLAAVAQRTRRLRFGPLVYALSMHHPLRVFEEVCMLDQMSGGRFELGIGRGHLADRKWLLRRRCRKHRQDLSRGAGRHHDGADLEAGELRRRGLSSSTMSRLK